MKSSKQILGKALGAATLAAAVALTGCATPTQSGSTYDSADARRPMSVQMGTVQGLRDVQIENSRPSGIGPAGGAVVGGIAGSAVGGGRGAVLATVLGALAGGVGGSFAERAAGNKAGVEITVRTDDGQTFAIVQQASNERFEVGQRVRVLRDPSNGQTRVAL